jgi:hypothetical protein
VHPYFPTPAGARWTYRDTWIDPGGAPGTEEVAVRVGEARPEELLHYATPTLESPVGSRPAADAAFMYRGDALHSAAESRPEGVLVYAEQYGLFSVAWCLPSDLHAGGQWTSHEVQMSCGWAVFAHECQAVAEEVSVEAGTFQALRVEIDERSRWFVKGLGVVKEATRAWSRELLESTLSSG